MLIDLFFDYRVVLPAVLSQIVVRFSVLQRAMPLCECFFFRPTSPQSCLSSRRLRTVSFVVETSIYSLLYFLGGIYMRFEIEVEQVPLRLTGGTLTNYCVV